MSSSSAKTSSSQQQSTTTTNLNLQDTSGVTVVGNTGRTSVVATDFGAIKGAADFASTAAQTAADISGAALSLGRSGIDAGVSVANGGLDLAAQAIGAAGQSADRVSRFATDAIDTNSDLAKQLSANILDAGAGVLNFAQDLFSQALAGNRSTVEADIAGINSLAGQVSQSSQQSVNDAVVKLATIAAIAIAAVFIFRGMK